eukprot:CAMPEP_0202964192 /NCGR_PEP_ID=MMETSP1396-20130829/8272_1 /ASSEMBLY_ACC=CAM_ASM_000872 /TAXON_ID= /ORGANISM="Pseudokeronopsis sp., Strain Brazil" /LENGTH=72 /DNA_ID=CAMNT_0049686105 /DNA_START=54 /DNA_END=272 /DNA_ORIENTATION=-
MIELKNGETYDGVLVGADNYMNLRLSNVTITSPDGSKFSSCKDTLYIRGNNIKNIQMREEVVEKHAAAIKKK